LKLSALTQRKTEQLETMSTATSLAATIFPSRLAEASWYKVPLAGREACFEELVAAINGRCAMSIRMIGDYDSALDLTQEVFY